MDVVRDVLDELVVDRSGREMGRVDGIVLDQEEGQPPRLAAILIGPAVLGLRLHPTLGRWVAALEHAFGVDRGRPLRVDFRDVEIGREVRIRKASAETPAETVERLLRAWLTRIPGGR